MQTTTLNSSEVAQNARVVRILRSPARNQSESRHVAPSAALHKPPSKWIVVVAFVLALALHAAAVVWFEMQKMSPTLEADARVLAYSIEEFPEMSTAGDTHARSAAD